MTNKETIAILKPLFEQCKGTDGCLGYIEHYFSKDEEMALDLAIQALEFTESQILCCDNCVNRTRKSKEVCTSPYGQCKFFDDKSQEENDYSDLIVFVDQPKRQLESPEIHND